MNNSHEYELEEKLKSLEKEVESIVSAGKNKKSKDIWDKLSSLSAIISGLVIALIGGFATYTYNQRQLDLRQISTIREFYPLLENTAKRTATLDILKELGNEATTIKLARHFPDATTMKWLANQKQNISPDVRKLLAQTLSDLELYKFVDATFKLKTAVAESGASVASELRYGVDGGAKYADQLTDAWKARNRAFTAIAAYADSLLEISTADNPFSGLADSVMWLAETAAIPIPRTAPEIAGATYIIKNIVEDIKKVRAAKSLAEAMGRANPAVEEIIRLISVDLKDLDELFFFANKMAENRHKIVYNERIGYRKGLEDFIQKTNVDFASERDLNKLRQVNELLGGTDGWYAGYQQGLEDISKRMRFCSALLQTADASLNQWVNAHTQVATALKNQKPADVSELSKASDQIYDLIKELRVK